MNIADKARLYRETHRVLKSDGWLVLSEIVGGGNGDVAYPTPCAATAGESFLSTVVGNWMACEAPASKWSS
jgi:hypothetical protein